MNRIILIGNGFDLAHGLKTSYQNFIDGFWEKEKKKTIDGLVKENVNFIYKYENEFIQVQSPCSANDLPKEYVNAEGMNWFKKLLNSKFGIIINGKPIPLKIRCKNTFLETISKKVILQDWVNIEEEYYHALNECLDGKKGYSIDKLNNELLIIKSELENYLNNQRSMNIEQNSQIYKKIYTPSISSDFIIRKPKYSSSFRELLFLSFNYTNIERLYEYATSWYSHSDNYKGSYNSIHIHGELNNLANPPIFGYGDEMCAKYKIIENKNDNKYLENIKSIKYLETHNYKKLIQFIDSNEYQIFVMGHSCGISDRTLLNTLFEHENCLSIKVFFYQKDAASDNFSDVVRNISRNFNNKSLMRKIVVDKEFCQPLS